MMVDAPLGPIGRIPMLEERYAGSLLASVGIHLGILAFAFFAPLIFPAATVVLTGSGVGGGQGGELYTVGVVDDLGGGSGMTKPSLVPQPPALLDDKKELAVDSKAVPFRDLDEPRKPKARERADADAKKHSADSKIIPVSPQPGAGGSGAVSSGSGGGRGGGSGVSIGLGSGGFGDSWYARTVEMRISGNWLKPAGGVRVEIIFSFFIAPDGSIYNITKEKSCGNDALDMAAERAIRASNPLSTPPPELRGRPVQFVAQFIYPPENP